MRHIVKLVSVGLLLFVVGCGAKSPPQPESLNKLGSGLVGVESAVDFASEAVAAALPFTLGEAKGYLMSAQAAHAVAKKKLDQANKDLNSAQAEQAVLTKRVEEETNKYLKLAAKWYVVGGVWAERIFWAVVAAYVAAGIASIVFALMGGGWPAIGKSIVRALPFMNPFTWIRDLLLRRREKKSLAAVDPLGPDNA